MIKIALSFFLGTLVLQFFPSLPEIPTIFIWFIIVILVIVIFAFKHMWLFVCVASTALGFFWCLMQAHYTLEHALPENLQGQKLIVVGTIEGVPELKSGSYYFDFNVKSSIPILNWKLPAKIKLHWHTLNDLGPGDQWQFTVKVKKARYYANPGSFDVERHMFHSKLVAQGYVLDALPKIRLEQHPYRYVIQNLRHYLKLKINEVLKNGQFASIIQALMVGLQGEITKTQWNAFRNTGTAHLVAISGLHIGLMASFGYFLSGIFCRLIPGLMFKFPVKIFASIVSFFLALFYALLAGFSTPTRRAIVMVAIMMLGNFLKRSVAFWHCYCLALFLVILIDPLSSLSAGFWLSFSAVGALIYGMKGRIKPYGHWWKWGRAQWVVFLALMPLSLNIFKMTSFSSPLANILVIPWVSFTVVPLCLISAFFILVNFDNAAIPFLKLAEMLMSPCWSLLRQLSNLSVLNLTFGSNSWFVSLAIIGFILALAPKGFPGKWTAIIWIVPIILIKPATLEEKQARVTILDVGQGLAAVIETRKHVLVFDAGPKMGASDAGEKIILPFLAERGLKSIDMLMISHGDLDHVGGAQSILKNIPVRMLITSEIDLFKKYDPKECYAGLKWNWDGVDFELLHPAAIKTHKRNDHACVLKIQAKSDSTLLTADIEAASEKLLLSRMPNKLPSNYLLVPHHGSLTSSTLEFVKMVNPTFAIIPVGYRNRYNHPRKNVLERYQTLGVRIMDTISGGAITYTLGNEQEGKEPQQYRLLNKRYWHLE